MKRRIWMLPTLLAALAALMAAAIFMNNREEPAIENQGQSLHAPAKQDTLTYGDRTYPVKKHLNTVLLIGTDSEEAYVQQDALQDYYNYNQADFLILLVQDLQENTTQVIQLNRDTMTDVPWLDVLGNYGGTQFQQICRAFNSGDGGRASCLNTVDAVSALLFDAPVRHYIQVPMSAIPVMNNLVGGVPVKISEDLTKVDPAFTAGSTVCLTGDQAEKFVRARRGLADDTNTARMERQRIYLEGFQKQIRQVFREDPDVSVKLAEKLGEFIQTDLTARQLSELMESLDRSRISPIRSPEGELLTGADHYEFFVEEESLWQLVHGAYCG